MDNKSKILKLIVAKKRVKTSELAKTLQISRQKVVKHLNTLIKDGLISKDGSTRNSSYQLAPRSPRGAEAKIIHMVKNLKGLNEDQVYKEVELKLPIKNLGANVKNIIFYAFSEMLNNAIDHSRAPKAKIDIELDKENLVFKIKDSGIGIFANVMGKFKLQNEFEALEHVLKGKQTTFPEQHSGQGIFFTSKIADIFKIRSHKIEVTKNNINDDLRVKEIHNLSGTEVIFQLKRRSKKLLKDLFVQYANDEFEFDRTNVKVHLTAERELLARSQARRIMIGLEQYKIVTLDFKKVKEIGQAFVDEIFRVFKNRHPEIQINYINASPGVEFMILRGQK